MKYYGKMIKLVKYTIMGEPIRIIQYPIPYAMRDVVKEEITKMLKADVCHGLLESAVG